MWGATSSPKSNIPRSQLNFRKHRHGGGGPETCLGENRLKPLGFHCADTERFPIGNEKSPVKFRSSRAIHEIIDFFCYLTDRPSPIGKAPQYQKVSFYPMVSAR